MWTDSIQTEPEILLIFRISKESHIRTGIKCLIIIVCLIQVYVNSNAQCVSIWSGGFGVDDTRPVSSNRTSFLFSLTALLLEWSSLNLNCMQFFIFKFWNIQMCACACEFDDHVHMWVASATIMRRSVIDIGFINALAHIWMNSKMKTTKLNII